MKNIRFGTAVLAGMLLMSSHAYAADFSVETTAPADYYDSTSYEDIYGARYNYGGQNAVDFLDPLAQEGVGVSAGNLEFGLGGEFYQDESLLTPPVQWETPPSLPPAEFTSASEVKRADGSVGTLVIPSLGIRYKAFDGTSADAMRKGVGHFPSSSAWEGNVALCGHNRGSNYNIGKIKDMEIGDTIRYETKLGTKTYSVSFVKIIDWTDWSCLDATADNRITIVTCLANQPEKRVCVQAVEVRS